MGELSIVMGELKIDHERNKDNCFLEDVYIYNMYNEMYCISYLFVCTSVLTQLKTTRGSVCPLLQS